MMKIIGFTKGPTFSELVLTFKNVRPENMVAQYLADMECEEELLNQLVKKEDEGSLMIAYALIAKANEQNYNKAGYTYVWQDVFALLVARRPLVQDDFDVVFESMFDFEHYTKDEQGNPVLKR